MKEIDYYKKYRFPIKYQSFIELGVSDFGYWYLIPNEQLNSRIIGLKQRYPDRKLIPFARRDDCDDIACFDVDIPDKVLIIHDFAKNGYELKKTYNDLSEWFQDVIGELLKHLEDK